MKNKKLTHFWAPFSVKMAKKNRASLTYLAPIWRFIAQYGHTVTTIDNRISNAIF
jgi:hypothetical protein